MAHIYNPSDNSITLHGKKLTATFATKEVRAFLQNQKETIDITETHDVEKVPSRFHGTVGKIKVKPEYFEGFDKRYKKLHTTIDELTKEFGWKDIYFAILKYQEEKVKSGYILKKSH